jgi:hypothetical protein
MQLSLKSANEFSFGSSKKPKRGTSSDVMGAGKFGEEGVL